MNPNSSTATVKLTYMIEGCSPVTKTKTVAAYRNATFSMESDVGSHDASIKVTSNVPVVPERSMYRNNEREGHCSIGTVAPATDHHTKSSHLTVSDSEGNIVDRVSISNGLEQVRDALGCYDEPLKAVLEAGYNWGRMCDWLDELADEVVLAHPLKVRAIAEARRRTTR